MTTALSTDEHYGRVSKRIQDSANATRTGARILILGLVVFIGGFVFYYLYQPSQFSTVAVLVLLLVSFFALGCLILAGRFEVRAKFSLPPLSDQIFYHLHSANNDLRSFSRTGSISERNTAVDSLGTAANLIDQLSWGNIKFLQSIGQIVVDFRKNFRGRLIPAVKRVTQTNTILVLATLMEIEDAFDTDSLSQTQLVEWNAWLTQKDTNNSPSDKYPYVAPVARQTRISKLKSHKHQMTFLISAVIGTPLTYFVITEFTPASHDAAVYSSVVVLGIVVAAYFAYLPLTRQKTA